MCLISPHKSLASFQQLAAVQDGTGDCICSHERSAQVDSDFFDDFPDDYDESDMKKKLS